MKILKVSNVTFEENLTLGPVNILRGCDLAETIIQSVSTQRLVSLVSRKDELFLDQLQTSAVTFLFLDGIMGCNVHAVKYKTGAC